MKKSESVPMIQMPKLVKINIEETLINQKIILLTEGTLNSSENTIINKYLSSYYISEDDNSRYIDKLPDCEIYICDIRTCIQWYYLNLNKLNNFIKIYYRKLGLITKYNINRLHVDFVRKYLFPDNYEFEDKEDLVNRLSTESEPYVRSCCGICCSCLMSRITCGQFCNYMCKALSAVCCA